MRSVYIMGSMRCLRVPEVAKALRSIGWEAFDDWYSPGPETDDKWQEYERARGRTFAEALAGYHAKDVFDFDKHHLDRCDRGVLVLPAGKSAHIELGYLRGCGKPAYILMDGEPERYDIMYLFATKIFTSLDDLLKELA
jgi:nucleoside 2-deoxyribosyltransferase